MQFFYDGQIRRYLVQTIRVFSNFVVKYGDGTLHRVPVQYGDPDRQAASVINQNSENGIAPVPKIAVYISGLELDSSRLADSTHYDKLQFRERDIDTGTHTYTQGQGRNYTVERLMPTPFKLTMKVDIWSASTEQKLQILEQILVLFNPTMEIQTTDNYVDWTSLSVLSIASMSWSSRQVPVGTTDPIDIANITLTAPIWISPPVKVKHLGVITSIITNIHDNFAADTSTYIDGLGMPLTDNSPSLGATLSTQIVTVDNYQIQVYNSQAFLMPNSESVVPPEPTLDIPTRQGTTVNWEELFQQYSGHGKYIAGVSKILLVQSNGTYVIGTIAVSSLDPTMLQISWDQDTTPTNTNVDSQGIVYPMLGYGTGTQYRSRSPGTFDAIIDPTKIYPGHGMSAVVDGDRFLIVDDIAGSTNRTYIDSGNVTHPGTAAWGTFAANANDIIEWHAGAWHVIFNSSQESSRIIYQTNIYTGVQYVWNGVHWAKSFEGEYKAGSWKLEL